MMDPAPKVPSSAYKSLLPQQNGMWGDQIYDNHHPGHHPRWLQPTTCFQTENEAAAVTTTAAAAMFRAPHGTVNFHPYQEDTNSYDEDDPDEQIVEERDNIEVNYRDDGQEEQGAPEEEEQNQETEHMFEKPLTPSDVGKLNRLVIPKQHAERYFPLGGGGSSGESGGEKGLLLNFEDESGKAWRFRYSYWNSSQSYVLTKGWSRFVKEKRLDAGDVVLFERHRVNGERFYIRWRRRAAPVQDSRALPLPLPPQHEGPSVMGAWTRVLYSGPAPPLPPPSPYHHHQQQQQHYHRPSHLHGHGHGSPSPMLYQADFLHADIARTRPPVVQNPTAPGNWKRLRLFGVNLDCQMLDDAPHPYPQPMPDDASSPSGQHHHHQLYPTLLPPQAHKAQEDIINFQREINQTRNLTCRPDLSM